ncbi:hypothetical protein AXG93_93s1110 [Marchantia polymorpha subsp. ruderalis]|uniref:Uncharacterized protein n=1 Tax=Marchantia polymorpha subsp. ruderalis TaxID=1480154 RepID=A0A176WUL1_MARPO|nr:hypothetical protein AXG93_93s1110 [Marchantia polymorpha subsp. ruderalis]
MGTGPLSRADRAIRLLRTRPSTGGSRSGNEDPATIHPSIHRGLAWTDGRRDSDSGVVAVRLHGLQSPARPLQVDERGVPDSGPPRPRDRAGTCDLMSLERAATVAGGRMSRAVGGGGGGGGGGLEPGSAPRRQLETCPTSQRRMSAAALQALQSLTSGSDP